MSNISRRKFLKGAGAAALAVAAAGVLAGCSGSKAPEESTPGVPDQKVTLIYMCRKTSEVNLATKEITVSGLTTTITPAKYELPEELKGKYVLDENANVEKKIENGKVYINLVPAPTTKPVTFVYEKYTATGTELVDIKGAKTDDVVAINATTVSTENLIPATREWEAINETENIGADNIVTVYVQKRGGNATD